MDVYNCGSLSLNYAGFEPRQRSFLLDLGLFQYGAPVFDQRLNSFSLTSDSGPPPGTLRMREKHDNRLLDALHQVLGPAGFATWSPQFPPFTCQMRLLQREYGNDRLGAGSIAWQPPPLPRSWDASEIPGRAQKRAKLGGPLPDDYVELLFLFADPAHMQGPAFVMRPQVDQLTRLAADLADDWAAIWHSPAAQHVFNPPPPRRRPTRSFADTVAINNSVAAGPQLFAASPDFIPPMVSPSADDDTKWLLPNDSLEPRPALAGEPHIFTRRGKTDATAGVQYVWRFPRSQREFEPVAAHPYVYKKAGHLVIIDRIEITADRMQAMLFGRVVNSRAEQVDGPSVCAYITNWQYARHRVRAGGIFHVSLGILVRKLRKVFERHWLVPQAATMPVERAAQPTGRGPEVLQGLHPDQSWFADCATGRPDDIVFSGVIDDCYELTTPYLGQKAMNGLMRILPAQPKDIVVGFAVPQPAIDGDRTPWRGDWVEGCGWLTAEVAAFEDFRWNIIEEEGGMAPRV